VHQSTIDRHVLMTAWGLGRVKTSAPKALREAGILLVGGIFPGLSPGTGRRPSHKHYDR
jgi:hypothetical protein